MPIRELRPICPVCCCVHTIIVPSAALVSIQKVKCLQCGAAFETKIPRSGEWEMKPRGQQLFGR
jgi:transcription elongation factor Elf1